MTNLEIILIAVLWVLIGSVIGHKWEKVNSDTPGIMISLFFCPIILIGAIIRQVFLEPWK